MYYNNKIYYYNKNMSTNSDSSLDYGSDSSSILENMTEEEIERCYPNFDSTTEYLFVNKCLSLIYGPLPSYAYYNSNDDIKDFWLELEDEHYPTIYHWNMAHSSTRQCRLVLPVSL